MTAGRPPKPTSMHKLHGTYRKDRHKGRADEGTQFEGAPVKPRGMTQEEQKVWKRIIDCLPRSVLASADAMELEAACKWWVRHEQLLKLSKRYASDFDTAEKLERRAAKAWGITDRILSRFGMTPADRTKIRTPKKGTDNPLSEFGIVG